MPYTSIGCYSAPNYVAYIEGKDTVLDGSYTSRANAIDKCYQAAKKRMHEFFALQYSGMCLTAANFGKTYSLPGKSVACLPDGEGAPRANQVYGINGFAQPFQPLGCFKSRDARNQELIPSMEYKDHETYNSYASRKMAALTCYKVALKNGHKCFGLQFSGRCHTSKDACTVARVPATTCRLDGEGGSYVNELYQITSKSKNFLVC